MDVARRECLNAAGLQGVSAAKLRPFATMWIHDYIIDHDRFDWPKLLENWEWLLPPRLIVWIMNRFGDLFIVLDDGTIHMLDIGAGTLSKVAESREDFAAKIDEDENANNWLMIPLIDRLVASGITLEEGKCYSYRQPPILGGGYTIENTAVVPISDHYGAYGSIHEQVNDVPDGGQVIIEIERRD